MKLIYLFLLTILLSANAVAGDGLYNQSGYQQNYSQEGKFLEKNSSVFIPNTEYKVANLKCGFKPFKPIGCHNGHAVCSCDSYGNNCHWVWVGCG